MDYSRIKTDELRVRAVAARRRWLEAITSAGRAQTSTALDERLVEVARAKAELVEAELAVEDRAR
jgi:hypothetical protein